MSTQTTWTWKFKLEQVLFWTFGLPIHWPQPSFRLWFLHELLQIRQMLPCTAWQCKAMQKYEFRCHLNTQEVIREMEGQAIRSNMETVQINRADVWTEHVSTKCRMPMQLCQTWLLHLHSADWAVWRARTVSDMTQVGNCIAFLFFPSCTAHHQFVMHSRSCVPAACRIAGC